MVNLWLGLFYPRCMGIRGGEAYRGQRERCSELAQATTHRLTPGESQPRFRQPRGRPNNGFIHKHALEHGKLML